MSTTLIQHHQPGRLDVALAVDIGGTTLKGAAIDASGSVVGRRTIPTFSVGDDAYAGVRSLLGMLRADVVVAGHTPAGIGLASPGLVDPASGTITFAANLGWDSLPLRSRLEKEFHVPVHVGHDARTGAVAERAARAGTDDRAFDDFVFVPIGTGVSAAVVTGGVLVEGATGAAGEFGHMPAIPGGDRCGCGQDGCIEAYASATSILARYARQGGALATSTRAIGASIDSDPVAAAVWRDAVEALAIGVTALSAVLDPALIVIGGGLSGAGKTLLAPLRARVGERLAWRGSPCIERSALTSRGGLVGAAMLGWTGHELAPGFATAAHRSLALDSPTLAAEASRVS